MDGEGERKRGMSAWDLVEYFGRLGHLDNSLSTV